MSKNYLEFKTSVSWASLAEKGGECGCLKANSFLLPPRLPGMSLADCLALELLTGMC